ncbi:MAG: sulfatase [Acidobacteria bacterium]|nr:sulfatase [Acidobacteriota bacterium]
MTRRTLCGSAAAALVQTNRRPNVLLLLADNWAAPHAGALGDRMVKTPVFDRLASEGAVFTHAFAPNPSCSPSRSSLLSGQETHRLGEAASLYGPLAADVPIYTDLLTQAGYFTGFSGKGFGPGSSPRPGRTPNPAGAQHASFESFLQARPAGAPFCFWFGSHDPHVPWDRGRQRLAALDPAKLRVPAHLPDDEAVRRDMLHYYCEVQEFDSECGRLLDTLQKTGELDNTLVIMTSDNGWQMPRGLANCYDLGVRIPLALRLPGRISKATRRDDFAAIGDLAPTILDAAGLARPAVMTAQSLLGAQRRDAIMLERERHANVRRGDLSYPVRGIRTRDYLYLRNLEPGRWPAGDPEFYWAVGPYGDIDDSQTKQLLMREKRQPYFDLCFGKRPAEELYDLKNDPDQVRNVASEAAYSKARAALSARVGEWMKASGDPRAGGPTDLWDKAPYSGPKFKGAPPPP